MPSDAEMTAYAKELPDIFRDIRGPFPTSSRAERWAMVWNANPAMHFANTRRGYSLGEVKRLACGLPTRGSLRLRMESSLTRPTSESN